MRALVSVAVFAVLGVACAKRVPVSYEEPPPVFIESGAPLFVKADTSDRGGGTNFLQVMGSVGSGLMLNRWAAAPIVEREFADAMRRSGYTVTGAAQGAVLHLELDPTNWQGEKTDSKQKYPNLGVITVEMKLVDPNAPAGAQPVLFKRYVGRGQLSRGEQNAMDDAVRACAQQLLFDLSPKHVERRLPLDKSDPLTEPGIQASENNRFEEALQLFTEASSKAPQSGALVYNRAVLLLWKGQLDEADALLSQAIKLNPGDGDYAQAKTFSENALRARVAWGGRQPPPPARR